MNGEVIELVRGTVPMDNHPVISLINEIQAGGLARLWLVVVDFDRGPWSLGCFLRERMPDLVVTCDLTFDAMPACDREGHVLVVIGRTSEDLALHRNALRGWVERGNTVVFLTQDPWVIDRLGVDRFDEERVSLARERWDDGPDGRARGNDPGACLRALLLKNRVPRFCGVARSRLESIVRGERDRWLDQTSRLLVLAGITVRHPDGWLYVPKNTREEVTTLFMHEPHPSASPRAARL